MKKLIILMMSFILFSCSGKYKVPPGILQREEMQNVLWDIMRAQALAVEMARKDSTIREVAQIKMLTQEVFDIHHINSSDFDKSYAWYTSHPHMMRMVLDSMNSRNQRQSELRMKGGYKSPVKDSAKAKGVFTQKQNEMIKKGEQKHVLRDSIQSRAIYQQRQLELKMKRGYTPLLKTR